MGFSPKRSFELGKDFEKKYIESEFTLNPIDYIIDHIYEIMCYADSCNLNRKDLYDSNTADLFETTCLSLTKVGFRKDFAEDFLKTLGMRILRNVQLEDIIKIYFNWKKKSDDEIKSHLMQYYHKFGLNDEMSKLLADKFSMKTEKNDFFACDNLYNELTTNFSLL